MRRTFNGMRVVVTGASSGIGAALAEQLVGAGAAVLLVARREQRLRELSDRLGERAAWIAGDLTHPATVDQICGWVDEHWGASDVLINNAGVGAVGPFETAPPDRLRSIMDVNLFAPAQLTRQLLPLLRRGNRPAVVNIGSVLGYVAVPDKSEYCASKFALRAWSDALRFELSGVVDVVLVSPSSTESEFFQAVIDSPREFRQQARKMPAARVARLTLRALRVGRREVVLSVGGRALVRAQRWLPNLVRPWLRRARLVPDRLRQ